MKIGDIIDCDGKQGKVIGFTTVEGGQHPNTEPYDGEPIEEIKEPIEEDAKELETEETPTEEPEIIDSEPIEVVETTEAIVEPTEATGEVFKCQYCGRTIKSKVGLASHEKACKENPANK